jgi:hypothetical protein
MGQSDQESKEDYKKFREDYRYPVGGTIGAVIGTTGQAQVTTQRDSYFVVQKLVALSTGTFQTQIKEGGTGYLLSDPNVFINRDNLFGTAQRPNILIDPLVIPPSSLLIFSLVNGIAGANTFEMVLEGYKHYDLSNPPIVAAQDIVKPYKGAVKWFQYAQNISSLGGARSSNPIRVSSEANFVIRKYVASSTGAFTVNIVSTGAATPLMDSPVSNANFFGTAQRPNIIHKSRWVRKNSTLQIEVVDTSAAPNAIQIVLEGAKIFD